MTARRALFIVIVTVIAALGAAACDGPAGPSLNLAGTWAGTLTFDTAGVTVVDNVTATLQQSGSAVTGTWTSEGGTSGTFTFTAEAQVSGTMTITQTLINGLVCNGSTSLNGDATASRLELDLGTLATSGVCQWGTNQSFLLMR